MMLKILSNGAISLMALIALSSVAVSGDYECQGTGTGGSGPCQMDTLINGAWVRSDVPKGSIITTGATIRAIGEGWATP